MSNPLHPTISSLRKYLKYLHTSGFSGNKDLTQIHLHLSRIQRLLHQAGNNFSDAYSLGDRCMTFPSVSCRWEKKPPTFKATLPEDRQLHWLHALLKVVIKKLIKALVLQDTVFLENQAWVHKFLKQKILSSVQIHPPFDTTSYHIARTSTFLCNGFFHNTFDYCTNDVHFL